MIINDDVLFGFTMYHGDGEIDTSLLISMPLINGCRHHRLCQRSHRRHRDTKNGRRHQMSAMKNFCFCKT